MINMFLLLLFIDIFTWPKIFFIDISVQFIDISVLFIDMFLLLLFTDVFTWPKFNKGV